MQIPLNAVTVVDIETSFQIDENGEKDPSPHNPENFIVSLGYLQLNNIDEKAYVWSKDKIVYLFNDEFKKEDVQSLLENTVFLVGHNLKFELGWFRELAWQCYPCVCWDTMLVEYLFARGQKLQFDLDSCCARYGLPRKRTDLIQEYMDNNISFENIPRPIVKEYGVDDVYITARLFIEQLQRCELI